MTMDVGPMKTALDILNHIPSGLHGPTGSGAKPVDDLKNVSDLPNDLKGFGVNGGTAANWIAQCVNDLYGYINQLVTDLQTQCGSIGTLMSNSINAYTGSDTTSTTDVNDAGAPVTSGSTPPTSPATVG